MLDFSQYKNFKTFQNKQIMAIDFGSQVVGTALYMPGKDPFPYPAHKIILANQFKLEFFLEEVKKLIDEEAVDLIVFGIPYFVDGKESEQTKSLKKLALSLEQFLSPMKVYLQDETLTTNAAKERMLSSVEYNFKVDPKRLDCLSACIILEDFIRAS